MSVASALFSEEGFPHLFKAALPLAASTRARTRVRSKLASLLMIHLRFNMFTATQDFKINQTFSVWRRDTVQPPLEYLQGNITVEATWWDKTKKTDVFEEHLLHGEVPNVPSKLASAGGAAGELRSAVGADQMARVALGRERGIKKSSVKRDVRVEQSRKLQYMILGQVIYLKDRGEDIVKADRALK